ncbi:MAG: DUF302 domain-containing protein [Pseudomonadota bacterium]
MRLTTLALAATVIAGPAIADDFVRKTSPHDVATTIDRLAEAVEAAGAKVFARIDHAAGAEQAGLSLRPNTVLLFGNPKMGTPMMASSGSMGLDLPLKVVAYEAADGSVQVVYRDVPAMAAEHGAEAPTVAKAAGALDKLTNKAIAAE